MSIPGLSTALEWVERGRVPDALIRMGIRRLCAAGLKERAAAGVEAECEREERLASELRRGPIAVHTAAANEQHYELPPEFFGLCLGARRKYSGCYWPAGTSTLDEAEVASLRVTCEHAQLADGQDILELGCGWGALTLWMAQHFPRSRITAVSNARPQREYIEDQCRRLALSNVRVITADMNDFATEARFDRVVSVEMFEHMRNHAELMRRIAGWLKGDGKLLVHIFVHGRSTYLFDVEGPANWMGRHFFTGGIMPSDHWLLRFQDELALEAHWRQAGTHYQRTANAWLENLDARRDAALEIISRVYGAADRERWLSRWRVFFMACAEMFGYARGGEWWVAHYRFRRRG